MILKQDLYLSCLEKTPLTSRDTCKLKARGWKKAFHANGIQKKIKIAILISDKIGFKGSYKRERALDNDKGINMRRRYKKYQIEVTGLKFIICA